MAFKNPLSTLNLDAAGSADMGVVSKALKRKLASIALDDFSDVDREIASREAREAALLLEEPGSLDAMLELAKSPALQAFLEAGDLDYFGEGAFAFQTASSQLVRNIGTPYAQRLAETVGHELGAKNEKLLKRIWIAPRLCTTAEYHVVEDAVRAFIHRQRQVASRLSELERSPNNSEVKSATEAINSLQLVPSAYINEISKAVQDFRNLAVRVFNKFDAITVSLDVLTAASKLNCIPLVREDVAGQLLSVTRIASRRAALEPHKGNLEIIADYTRRILDQFKKWCQIYDEHGADVLLDGISKMNLIVTRYNLPNEVVSIVNEYVVTARGVLIEVVNRYPKYAKSVSLQIIYLQEISIDKDLNSNLEANLEQLDNIIGRYKEEIENELNILNDNLDKICTLLRNANGRTINWEKLSLTLSKLNNTNLEAILQHYGDHFGTHFIIVSNLNALRQVIYELDPSKLHIADPLVTTFKTHAPVNAIGISQPTDFLKLSAPVNSSRNSGESNYGCLIALALAAFVLWLISSN